MREPVGAVAVVFSVVLVTTLGVVAYFDESLVSAFFAACFALCGIMYAVAIVGQRMLRRRMAKRQRTGIGEPSI
jgi:hypothetical protein